MVCRVSERLILHIWHTPCRSLRQSSRMSRSAPLLAGALMLFAGRWHARIPAVAAPAASPQQGLVAGTKEAATFAMLDDDRFWHGTSIGLWRRIVDQLRLRRRIADAADVKEPHGGVAGGNLDEAMAALTVTEQPRSLVERAT